MEPPEDPGPPPVTPVGPPHDQPYAQPYGQPYGQPYPQQPYFYSPPAPPRGPGRTLAWVAIALSSLPLLAIGAVVVVFLFMGAMFSGFDEGFSDDTSAYDGAVEAPCEDMLAAAEEIELFVPPAQAAVQLDAFIAAGHEIHDALKQQQADDPWQSEWARLLPALEKYSATLKSGKDAVFDEPTVDGFGIVAEMNYESPYGCEIPPVIGALDRTPPDQDY